MRLPARRDNSILLQLNVVLQVRILGLTISRTIVRVVEEDRPAQRAQRSHDTGTDTPRNDYGRRGSWEVALHWGMQLVEILARVIRHKPIE